MPLRSKAILFAGAILCAGGMLSAHANSLLTFSVDMTNQLGSTFNPGSGDIVKVRGTFDGWSAGGVVLNQQGSSSVYTNTVNDTSDANGNPDAYVFLIEHPGPSDSYESVADFNNRAVYTPATSGGSLVLPTPFFADSGTHVTNDITFQVDMSQQINLTNFAPGTDQITVQGNFNGWTAGAAVLTNDPTILRTNKFGLVTSNVYVLTVPSAQSPNATMDYKFVIVPQKYEGVSAANSDSGGNRFFNETGSQVLPVVDYGDSPFAPLAQVTFSVDMSVVIAGDSTFVANSPEIDGDFNSWSAGIPCTNNPNAANPNVYSATISIGEGASVNYQFRYQSSANGTQYDHPASNPGGNRFFQVPSSSVVNVPTVFFNDVGANDVLNQDTAVTFNVDMTGATDFNNSTAFNGSQPVFLNGAFLGWLNWDPISLAGEQMTNNPPGSEVYSLTMTFSKGSPRELTYKYSFGGTDNEAASGNNHFRYIRSTNGVYNMPVDVFGHPIVEQKFGNLAVGKPSGGQLPVTWLGYPGVHLQSRTNLTIGSWQDVAGTDATSSTNVPTTGDRFFRLIQPAVQ